MSAISKLPSGVRSEAGLRVILLPGWPLKSFDCFASTPHVALEQSAIVTVTSALTVCPLARACELDFARNCTTLPAR
jgi:hypothetical protein